MDISGREIDFYYTTQGLMVRVVDGAGNSAAKTFNFTYDATQGNKNVKLVQVADPRGTKPTPPVPGRIRSPGTCPSRRTARIRFMSSTRA